MNTRVSRVSQHLLFFLKNHTEFYEALKDNYDRWNIKTENLRQFLTEYAQNPSVQVPCL